MKSLARIAVIATVSLLAIPSVASARTTLWGGGSGFNDLGPAYSLLNVQNGKAALTNVQLIMACTDAEDGTESSRAFDARHPTRVALDQNRFSFNFIARSNGGRGRVRVKGILRSNGTGVARARVEATATAASGAIVERCQGEARIQLRRGN